MGFYDDAHALREPISDLKGDIIALACGKWKEERQK
jgi:hypothetical protein